MLNKYSRVKSIIVLENGKIHIKYYYLKLYSCKVRDEVYLVIISINYIYRMLLSKRTYGNLYIHTVMVAAAMQGANQHIRSSFWVQ